MERISVSINIKQYSEYPKIFGVEIPFYPLMISDGMYTEGNGNGHGSNGPDSSLECLTTMLINAELNRNDKKIGLIKVVFDSIQDNEETAMEKILEMYARSEEATIKFEYK